MSNLDSPDVLYARGSALEVDDHTLYSVYKNCRENLLLGVDTSPINMTKRVWDVDVFRWIREILSSLKTTVMTAGGRSSNASGREPNPSFTLIEIQNGALSNGNTTKEPKFVVGKTNFTLNKHRVILYFFQLCVRLVLLVLSGPLNQGFNHSWMNRVCPQ